MRYIQPGGILAPQHFTPFKYSDTIVRRSLYATTCWVLRFTRRLLRQAAYFHRTKTAETIESHRASQGQNNVLGRTKSTTANNQKELGKLLGETTAPTPTTSPATYILVSSHITLYTFLFLLPGGPQSLTFPIHRATHPNTFLSPSCAHECQPSASTRMNSLKLQGIGVSCMNFASQTAGSKRR